VQGLVGAGMGAVVTAIEPKMAFGAYEPKDRHGLYRSNSFKIMLVASDCLLLGLQPVLVGAAGATKAERAHPIMHLRLCWCSTLHPCRPAAGPVIEHWRRGQQRLPLSAAPPLLQVHLSKNKEGTYSFNPVSVNFLVELTKTIIALIVLLFVVGARLVGWLAGCPS
jgi:hypothetical protein